MIVWATIMARMSTPPLGPEADSAPSPVVPRFYQAGQYRPQHSVGDLMRRVIGSVRAQADMRLAGLDLTYAQWLPLYRLALGSVDTVAALARELEMDPGAMTRALDRLEAKALVRRERSTVDRRVVHLQLTDAGRQTAGEVPPVLADVLNQHLAGFSADEWQQLLGLLQRMLANGERLRRDAAVRPAAGAGGDVSDVSEGGDEGDAIAAAAARAENGR